MSSLTSATPRTTILRGSDASSLTVARINADLRDNPFGDVGRLDPRFVDPTLATAFAQVCEEAREQARLDGFAAGHAEGLAAGRRDSAAAIESERAAARAADAARSAATDRALGALDIAVKDYALRQVVGLDDVEDLLLYAAYDLATTLVGRELDSMSTPVREAVRRALAMIPDDGVVTVSVHPVDAATLDHAIEMTGGRNVRIVADPNIEPGSCVADSGRTRVDASLTAALERVRGVLAP